MMVPLNIHGQCVSNDDVLFGHMDLALERGLPEIDRYEAPHGGVVCLAASGPSIAGQLGLIRQFRADGIPICAVRGAHDFLIGHGIVPEYATSVDPLEKAAECFSKPHPGVEYLIASQSHPKMFDYLAGMRVRIWHPYIKKDVFHPKGKLLIGGGQTSGLRAIGVFYVWGYRRFALFGYDSCLGDGALRVDGSRPLDAAEITEVGLSPDGERYLTTPGMALQAQAFQNQWEWMPDASFKSYGRGLITAMLDQREANIADLEAAASTPCHPDTASFIHSWTDQSASFRYRAAIPAREMGLAMNDAMAATLIFSKPQAHELMEIAKAKARGSRAIVDFCDDHFAWPHYVEALRLADAVSCPTAAMAARILSIPQHGRAVDAVIPDPYEFPEEAPHCSTRNRLPNMLWFGHSSNMESLIRLKAIIAENYPMRHYPFHVVGDMDGAVPWSRETMLDEFAWADIVLLPATDPCKGANRAVEAVRQGCFVVAEPHPALAEIPGIWVGNIVEGVEWAAWNGPSANLRTSEAQSFVKEKYSPRTVAAAWRRLMERPTTSAAATASGQAGSTSI